MSNEIMIIRPENMREIMQAAPQCYELNRTSRDNCVNFGQNILHAIHQQGMDDELDKQAAAFIEKARRTVKVMNERRSPVTKLFDQVRAAYTAVENEIDPTKTGTIGYQLQQLRNQYAAKKRAEEEKRLREEMERRQAEEAARKFRMDVEDDFKQKFQDLVNSTLNKITEVDNNLTLENYDNSLALLRSIKATTEDCVPAWIETLHTSRLIPMGIKVADVEKEIKQKLCKQFCDQYLSEVGDTVDYTIDRLPSKKANLERMAKADAEEAARIKAEMEARQKAEAERMEKERAAREAEEKRKAEMERGAAEIKSLFDGQAAVAGYQPKTKVTKKINLLNPEGIMPILSLWWSKEGCTLTVEELAKMFKKQITFCEKLANKEDIFVKNESVEYVDEVKAK
nr:MAG TPA: hypothetical protein [Caudoviricetes sp.]